MTGIKDKNLVSHMGTGKKYLMKLNTLLVLKFLNELKCRKTHPNMIQRVCDRLTTKKLSKTKCFLFHITSKIKFLFLVISVQLMNRITGQK